VTSHDNAEGELTRLTT